MATQVERARRLFTIEEYERMHEAGIITEDERRNLILRCFVSARTGAPGPGPRTRRW
jgi:hypothetical protein